MRNYRTHPSVSQVIEGFLEYYFNKKVIAFVYGIPRSVSDNHHLIDASYWSFVRITYIIYSKRRYYVSISNNTLSNGLGWTARVYRIGFRVMINHGTCCDYGVRFERHPLHYRGSRRHPYPILNGDRMNAFAKCGIAPIVVAAAKIDILGDAHAVSYSNRCKGIDPHSLADHAVIPDFNKPRGLDVHTGLDDDTFADLRPE